ncbi:3-alpha-(or 20-beta)-hydroxysteroid dehydrogenase [Oceanobacillus picturae]|uniref:3-alpha-(Or 20-beta)-hydroxysteroid dehydrogenase n=1 Tax=Oceanobacillus picturae TaxID=171693 RepID=A0A0U9H0J9_9BACI|nr:glucose 1-dehydrogenase [Oceanobacillus picturae]GAQ16186.1 3-alpha-(or 20-beta)-hydroxysteroid dehydrogenase [Oceanobacillus picturae]
MNRLENKVAIITGGAQGMGAAHVSLFVEQGAKVVLTDLNEKKGQALAAELGDNAIFVKQNVTSEEDWNNVLAVTEEKFGQVNVLVNNAGITMAKSILDISLEEYRRIVDINQTSVFLGMKTVAPLMARSGGGSIINISSMNGLVAGAVGYTDTKFAVRGMTKAAAMNLAAMGIRVNSVHPGVIATPMVVQEDTKAAVETFSAQIPLKRVAQPEEVSNMVLFLASDESSYSTGSEFVIDGGLTAQ